MKLFGLFVLIVCFALSSSLSESEKEEEIENALLKAIAEEEQELQGKEGVDQEEEEEDLDEIDLDEIYAKHDPFWWSSKSKQKQNTGHQAISVNASQPRKPATRRWLRIKQKAKSFLHGAHKVVTKAQEYAPHILKGIKYGAMLLGKKKRELRALETRQKHLKRQIQILEDEVMKKKK
ncbi:uncharacterized protein [Clytia hemisphaerica]|uniref:Cnidarian restricted protein n=1 Tax=Clytia hemisphaerica TaxID=252671 RepID=A0A7M5X530_9CNID